MTGENNPLLGIGMLINEIKKQAISEEHVKALEERVIDLEGDIKN